VRAAQRPASCFVQRPPLASWSGSRASVALGAAAGVELHQATRVVGRVLPVHNDAIGVVGSAIDPKRFTVFCQFAIVRSGPTRSATARNMSSSPQKSVIDA